jgi:hypothetical protein
MIIRNLIKLGVGTSLLVMIAFIYYQQTHLSIWGFSIPKSELATIIVQTEQSVYVIHEKEDILAIAKELSKMEKAAKVDSTNFPENATDGKYRKILLQTTDKVTYGGNVWSSGNRIDSNGYYWTVKDETLFLRIEEALVKAN